MTECECTMTTWNFLKMTVWVNFILLIPVLILYAIIELVRKRIGEENEKPKG
jgi:hypothetical protein